MATDNTGDWRDILDVALFEPNRGKLRRRIEHARKTINTRLDALMKDPSESERAVAERIALSDALTTLSELQRIVYARKPGVSFSGRDGRAAS